jgi:polygalacturonase
LAAGSTYSNAPLMSADHTARRDFLKVTAAGIAGAAVGCAVPTARAKPIATEPAVGGEYDVRAFGAKGDGKALDTSAINEAIAAASSAGGGTVRFPTGTYLCYSIHLKRNIVLSFSPGTTIVAADPPSQGAGGGYGPPEQNDWDKFQDFGHSHWHNSLIWGEGIDNVSILGPGLIWGKGLSRGSRDDVLPAGVGNKSISLKNCRNVTLRDFSILHGGHFAILATGVDNLTIDNLKIDTNRDGIDIDCCRNVRVSNCTINSPWDDGICLKSSYGLGFARSTENVTVSNCFVTGGYQEGTLLDGTYKRFGPGDRAPRNGRIKFGTESNGGFRNVTISNCVIEDCRGLALETVDGGLLEDVSINNITMRDITDVPIFCRLGSRMRGPPGAAVGKLRRVNISDVVASNCASRQACLVTGIPGYPIEDLSFSNIHILHQGGGSKEDSAVQPPELENAYPEPSRFGVIPAHGFYIRHVRGIDMRDVEVKYMKDDFRPPFVLDDVQNAHFFLVRAARAPGVQSFVLKSVENFSVHHSRPVADAELEKVALKQL